MKQIITSIIALTITINTYAQPTTAKLVETVTAKEKEIVIPYKKYLLPNGLTVLIHEDHSDPICHVDVTYHVGSNREQVGRSGFAHFFEHMMFQGSEHVADDEHFKMVNEAGGTLNGTTNSDRTNYFETLPANQLEVALWLEADRMGFLLDSVTQRKFEVQRATVKNERGQNFDNRPYGVVSEKIGEAMYPVGHPYSWSTIGYIEDLNRVDVNDLKKFFMRWYGPNNAVLTVAGDVNPDKVIALVEKYFAPIPKGVEVANLAKMPAKLEQSRYTSYEDKIRFPLLHIAFPTVNNYHPDEAPLDVLSSILGGSKNSLFYQNFVKSQLAVNASVSNPCTELSGQFTFSIYAYPDKKLSTMDSLVKATLLQFEKRGVTDDDLKRFKASHEAGVIGSLSSVSGKASQLAAYHTFTGNPNYIQQDLDRYLKVTKEDVLRVYNQYIKNKPAVYLSVYPKGAVNLAQPDNFQVPKRDVANVKESDEYKNLSYNKAKDNFDRSKKPTPGTAPVINIPELWKENFANGLKIIGTKNTEVPTVTLLLSIESGHRYEPKDKAGIAALTANLMNESTLKHTAEQMGDELEMLGSSINVSSGENSINITITSLKKNLDATLKLAEEILLQPKFDADEFARSKEEQLQGIANQSTQATAIANNVYNKLLYGENNILAVPAMGITPTVNAITIDDVKAYYKNNILPSIAQLIIVGDINKDEILPKINFLKNWNGPKLDRTPAASALPSIDKTKIYLVNKDKAAQSEIRMGYMSMPYDATGEYFKASIMNYSLGAASMNNRINMNLRESKGWTYGARANFAGNKYAGPYTASAGVKANATDSSITELVKEIDNYVKNGITDKELEFTKMAISQSEALRYETQGQKAGFLKRLLDYNLDKNYTQKQNEILKNITKMEIDELAKKHLNTNKMNMVVVGDKALIYEGLKRLGYPIIEVDNDGKPVVLDQQPLKNKDVEMKK